MIVAILQVRVSSSRLPNKVLKPILGKPMLTLQLERVQRSTMLDQLVVATSLDDSDDNLESLCKEFDIPCFRGSLEDVLDRFYQAAVQYQPEHVVRLTGDCPLADPVVIDQVVEFYLQENFDYASNTLEPTFPDGLDVEVFRFSVLEQAWQEAELPSQREHVTPFIHTQPDRFRLGSFKGDVDLSTLRWTVDELEDFELVCRIYEELYPNTPNFTTDDVLELLKRRPELQTINIHFTRNEGFQKSLLKDAQWLTQTKESKSHNTEESRQIPNLMKSLEMQNRAKKRIPGMTQLLSKRPDQFSLGVWPGYYCKAKGVEVWDLDGNRYIDMSIGGIGANILGYSDPDVDEAVFEAIRSGSSCSLNCAEEVELADLLCELHPWAKKVRYARTGGESMAIAVRIARAFTRKDKIAFCGYHGWHDWYLAANLGTENALGEHLLSGLNSLGVPKGLTGTALPFRYNQLSELETIVSENREQLAAIVIEPIRSDWPIPGFLGGVRALASEIGAVLIIDEISAGFRMNSGGAHLVLQYEPDIAVFSKAIGNGYPIGAIIGKSDIMEAAQQTFISSTYWTERIGPTAALATIRKHRQVNASEHLMAIGERVQEGWKTLGRGHRLPIHVGGIPPLSHFTFESEKALILQALFVQMMLERGFLASTSFYAMYAHHTEHVQQYLEAVDEVFDQLSAARQDRKLENRLKGQAAVAGFNRLT